MRRRGRALSGLLLWLAAVLGGGCVGGNQAHAEEFFSDLTSNFNFHGYLEAQQIWRNENFAKDYHIASLRHRIDLQPSGQFIKDVNLGPIRNLSINYFMDLRPGYEGVYDLASDRFGNEPTGFSGTGSTPFTQPIYGSNLNPATGAGRKLLQGFGYDLKSFKFYGARNFAFPDPIGPSETFLTPCKNCVNTNAQEKDLRWERDDSNRDYYPLREAYVDF